MTLYAAMNRFHRIHVGSDVTFAAYLPFYGACRFTLQQEADVSDRSIRLFHGSEDDWNKREECADYIRRLQQAGADAQFIVLEGARHAFDVCPGPPVIQFEGIENFHDCSLVEGPSGEWLDGETGEPFDRSRCLTDTAHQGCNEDALRQSVEAVTALLTEVFDLTP